MVQLVSTSACHAEGQGFEPPSGRQIFASVAQLVEQGTENPCVGGSIPPEGTICGSGSVVERRLAKANVASSNLVFRSNENCTNCAVFLLRKKLVQAMRTRLLRKGKESAREKVWRMGDRN